MITAAALVAAAAGLASQADAARFYLTAGGTLYAGNLGSNATTSASLNLPENGQRSPAIAFDSNNNLYAAVNNAGSTSASLYQVNGFADLNSFNPSVAFVSDLASPTNSFDFVGSGSSEVMIGTRNRLASDASGSGMIYFESNDNNYNSFTSTPANNAAFGNGSIPSTGYDAGSNTYYGVTIGSNPDNRKIVTINRNTGFVAQVGTLNLEFDGSVDYGDIFLAGGDVLDGTYYLSFWSDELMAAVIGSVDLTDGMFTELSRFNVGSTQPVSMGLAITVIPTPLAGVMGGAGLMLVGARRRRNG
jgi:hypothetical protein